MKITITGHTSGLGQEIYNHFVNQDYEVLGMSRSNGYDISKDDGFDRVVNQAKQSDIFFNNVYLGLRQAEFIKNLYEFTTIITSGSMAAELPDYNQYSNDKFEVEKVHKRFVKFSPYPMLLLKMGYLENWNSKSIKTIKFNTVLNYIDFWLLNKQASMINFDN